MIRKIVLAILSVAAIVAALYLYNQMSSVEKQVKPTIQKNITQVFTHEVKNGSFPITIKTSGNLVAKNRMEIYSEVNGIFKSSSHPFKPGVYYAKGDTLLSIEKQREFLNLKAQRASLYNQLVLLLPDLRFDYPESVGHWEKYINAYDVNKHLSPLPEASTDKEKLYIASKNILTNFYSIKNLEEQYSKFTIIAPYNGILISSLVDPGSAVRSGQKLGDFISPYTYELEVAINTSFGDLLRVGKKVELQNINKSQSWTGTVMRINSTVDPGTQTIPVFIEVRGSGLKEGMYLEAQVQAKNEENVIEIDRKLLIDNNSVYEVQDTLLKLVEIETVYLKEKSVLVRGLADGAKILSRSIPGAYEGMLVNMIEE